MACSRRQSIVHSQLGLRILLTLTLSAASTDHSTGWSRLPPHGTVALPLIYSIWDSSRPSQTPLYLSTATALTPYASCNTLMTSSSQLPHQLFASALFRPCSRSSAWQILMSYTSSWGCTYNVVDLVFFFPSGSICWTSWIVLAWLTASRVLLRWTPTPSWRLMVHLCRTP